MSKAADAFGRVNHNVEEDGDGDEIDGGEEEDEGDEIDGGEEEEGDDEEEVVEVDDEDGDGVEIVEEVEVVEDGDDDDEDEDRDDDDDESDEEEGEGDPDADLFGPDNAEYMQTTAQSRLKPPRLPPPQFPRKQDYRDARNGHMGGRYNDKGPPSGGRFGDKGGQGRFNDKGPPQRALLPTPPVWQAGMGWPGRSGQSQGNEALVADMKLGAVGHQDEVLRSKCPQFQEPSQIACYSRTADGNVHFDERCLRRFRRAVLTEIGVDLNEGYESFVAKKDAGNEGFGDLLACLRTKRISLDNIHFVTFRNNLNKILGTAYNRYEAWKMGVHKRCGTVYLDVHKLPETQNDFQQRSSYWGYSFERLATEDPSVSSSGSGNAQSGRQKSNGTSRSNVGAVDANVEYCAVIRTKLGAHRIVMGAEMDCFEGNPDGKRHYIELKTSRELAGHTVDKFEREKLLKFWIQSFLAGVSRIVVGFRDDSGHLVRTEVMGLKEITNRVKAKHHWEGGVCLAFADRVLCWLYGTVKENEDYILRFAPQFNRLELLKAHSCPQIISKHVEELDQTAQPQ